MHAGRNALRFGDHGQTVIYPHQEPNFRGMMVGHQTSGLYFYACTTCGYLEMQIADAGAMAFVQAQWPKVPPH